MDSSDLSPFFSGQSVLVTGGAGFIGSHLIERLTEMGARVTVIDNLQAGLTANLNLTDSLITWREGDVRDTEFIRAIVSKIEPRFVFHLAANASVPASVKDPAYDFETNSLGSFRMLEALKEKEYCKRVVIASSGAVYGEPSSFPIREENELAPISPYGASKLNSEITAQMMHRVYKVPVVIARLFNAYGPRMARFVILDFLRKLRNDPSVLEVLGNGKQIRDFTYVEDTVSGLLLLAVKGEPCTAYNISSGSSCSITDLAHRVISARGLEGTTRVEYTGSSWVGDAQRWEVSIDRLKSLGYTPKYTLGEGLKATISWFDSLPSNQ